jgi:hypothetical protein
MRKSFLTLKRLFDLPLKRLQQVVRFKKFKEKAGLFKTLD